MEIQTALLALQISLADILTLGPILVLVFLLLVLSNREYKISAEQSARAQEALMKDRDRLESELAQSVRDLEESKEARLNELSKAAEFGRMSQGIFHDLITPLTSVILHTEELKRSSYTRSSLEKALDASNRMAEYVRDIRKTLSNEKESKEFSPREELRSVLHLLSHKIKEKNVELTVNEAPDFIWHGNALHLRQIYSNLINNAIDACTNQEKKVGIVLEKREQDVLFEVSDTGVGISEEHLSKIFTPFFTTKPIDKGTGIGLTTVKRIVEKNLGGKIEVKSSSGSGSLFSITFPLRYRDPVASHQSPHTPPPRI